jgi:hypothetical protein
MSECGDRRVGDNEYEYDNNSDGGNNKCASRSLLLVMKNCVHKFWTVRILREEFLKKSKV